jgi:hypothetical protein
MPRVFPREQQAQTVQPKAVHIATETAVPVSLDPRPDVLAAIIEAPIAPANEPPTLAPVTAPAMMAPPTMASFTAPAEMPPLRAPAARASLTAPVVRPPVATPAAMATLLPQFSPPAAEIVAAPERVVEFTFSLDGLEAKYPLLRNAF